MNTNNSDKDDARLKKIEDVMRERDRLDKLLQNKFRRRMAIVFTDVCGYTKYMDTRGDIAGRAWIQKHNDIVLPLITQHKGTVLSLMGDGVMSSFEKTLDAVNACIAIQKGLLEYNRTADTGDHLHITIGINTGDILVDDSHIAGDTVNVASRIETKCEADQILISESAYEELRGSEDIICRKHGAVEVKGKSKPLELYRVIWQDEEIMLSPEPRIRSADGRPKRSDWSVPSVLELEATREDSRLKISAYEHHAGEVTTIRQYEEVPISIDTIRNHCHEIVETLNNCNRKGHLPRTILIQLRKIGKIFWDELFTDRIKETFQNSKSDHLVIHLDDQLVQIPWELLHDGEKFLCQGFNLGRLVKTRQPISGRKTRRLGYPLKSLIIADPEGNLTSALEEGKQLRDFFDRKKHLVNVAFHSEKVPADYLREKIRFFDFIHFAGHAAYNQAHPEKSGWQFSDGFVNAQEIIDLASQGTMPALIFSNACESARTEAWSLEKHFQDEIFGLANAFMLAGVKHYIGTFWEILDEPSQRFALEFYHHLLNNRSVGEAVRLARIALIDAYGEETIAWASYLLYGDPTFSYMQQDRTGKAPSPTEATESATDVKTRAAEISSKKERKRPLGKSPLLWSAAAAAVVLLAVLLWLLPLFHPDTTKEVAALRNFYTSGDFEQAMNAAETVKKKDADVRLTYLIEADIYLRNGNLKAAESAYQQALKASKGSDIETARALVGLGRIAALNQDDGAALQYYQQAVNAAPKSNIGYLSQAMFMDKKGNVKTALSLLEKANQLTPKDSTIQAAMNETRKRVQFIEDEKKQQRIDKLVAELLQGMDQAPKAAPTDGWTSRPLTLWMVDFKTQGYALQEGEDKLLTAGITGRLLENGRVQVVERALLDKLLAELKLSTSRLMDRSTVLSLGKLIAARLIVSGQIMYSGPYTQVSLRLIETESGKIVAAGNESTLTAVPVSSLADKLAAFLTEKINTIYPLQAKIVALKDGTATLNIGTLQGAGTGEIFSVPGSPNIDLRITAVEPNQSFAAIPETVHDLQIGQRVKIAESK